MCNGGCDGGRCGKCGSVIGGSCPCADEASESVLGWLRGMSVGDGWSSSSNSDSESLSYVWKGFAREIS
jgi:hypothetical protein